VRVVEPPRRGGAGPPRPHDSPLGLYQAPTELH
jgi:hypothetical protein